MKMKFRFSTMAMIAGALLMSLSLLAYKFYNVGFIGEVHSEVFGVGAGIFAIGFFYKMFRIKLS